MKKLLRLLHFLLFFSILIAVPPSIEADTTFNLTAHTGSYTIQSLPDRYVTFKLNLSTDTTQTIYPVAMTYFTAGRSYSLVNPWVTFDQSQYTIQHGVTNSIYFTVTTPPKETIYNGEYYQIVGLSNQSFTGAVTSNPPIILGIPVVIQIYGGLESSPPPGNPPAALPSTSVSNNLTQITIPSNPKKTFVPITQTPQINYPIHTESLYSSISLVSFNSRYNLNNQTATFSINLKNTGNISSTPTGFINIINLYGQVIDRVQINSNGQDVLPNTTKIFSISYKPKVQLLGELRSDLWLGYQNSQTEQAPEKVASSTLFYIPPNIIIFGLPLLLFLLLFLRLPKMIHNTYLRYFTFLLVISVIGSLIIFDLHMQKLNPQILGEESISVNAAVGENYEITGTISNTTGTFTMSSNRPNIWQVLALYKSFMDPIEVVTGGNGTLLGPYTYPLNPDIRAFMFQTVPF